jgi:hypothetical protein
MILDKALWRYVHIKFHEIMSSHSEVTACVQIDIDRDDVIKEAKGVASASKVTKVTMVSDVTVEKIVSLVTVVTM